MIRMIPLLAFLFIVSSLSTTPAQASCDELPDNLTTEAAFFWTIHDLQYELKLYEEASEEAAAKSPSDAIAALAREQAKRAAEAQAQLAALARYQKQTLTHKSKLRDLKARLDELRKDPDPYAILLTNYLGLMKNAELADREPFEEVWDCFEAQAIKLDVAPEEME